MKALPDPQHGALGEPDPQHPLLLMFQLHRRQQQQHESPARPAASSTAVVAASREKGRCLGIEKGSGNGIRRFGKKNGHFRKNSNNHFFGVVVNNTTVNNNSCSQPVITATNCYQPNTATNIGIVGGFIGIVGGLCPFCNCCVPESITHLLVECSCWDHYRMRLEADILEFF